MINYVVKVGTYDGKTRRRSKIGQLFALNAQHAATLCAALSQVATDTHGTDAMVFVRVPLPYGGSVDIPPRELSEVAEAIEQASKEVADWWQTAS